MNPNKEILDLIIPVYREDAIIKQTLNEISLKIKTPHRILIVYEDSADPTLPQVRDYIETESKKNILLIQSSQRKGVASAIKTGIHSANLPYVGILMADLSDDFSLVDKMVRKLDEGFDVVCGSRYMPGGKQIGGPLFKKILSYLAGRTLHFLTKIPTYDVTNSFRLYKLNSLKDLDIQETIGFAISLEILVKAFLRGYQITELPNTWTDREEGKSKFNLCRFLPHYLYWYWYLIQNISTKKKRVSISSVAE